VRLSCWVVATFLGLSPGVAMASQQTIKELGHRTELSEDEDWSSSDDILVKDTTVILTNGHRLKWRIAGNLTIDGSLKIISFVNPVAPSSTPPNGTPGVAGQPFNPGPGTEGCGLSCPGRPGGAGGAGGDGKPGITGASGGSVVLVVGGSASGNLELSLPGAPGGNGSNGGQGGPGGTGQQGGRAEPNRVLGGIAVGCKSGPGPGGNGGTGGPGGAAGAGGNGGAGGDATIVIARPQPSFSIKYSAPGGRRGNTGQPGPGGPGGLSGFGGRGAVGCEGRENERRGSNGPTGPTGATGQEGADGKPGSITVLPPSVPLQVE
jgi:hypothetical protein